MMRLFLFILVFLSSVSAFAQEENVAPFKTGLYFSAESFLKNQPDYSFNQLCDKKGKGLKDVDLSRGGYIMQGGSPMPYSSDTLFAYSQNNIAYIGMSFYGQRYFERLVLQKTLSLMVVNVEMQRGGGFTTFGAVPSNSYVEQVQVVFNFQTGNVVVFDEVSALGLFKEDEQILNEYMLLKKGKKKKKKYYYLNLFNQRYPLQYPVLN